MDNKFFKFLTLLLLFSFVFCTDNKKQKKFEGFSYNKIKKDCDTTLGIKIKHDFIKENDSIIRLDTFENIIIRENNDSLIIDFGVSSRYKNFFNLKIINNEMHPNFQLKKGLGLSEFDIENSYFEYFKVEFDTLNSSKTVYFIKAKFIIPNYDGNITEVTFNDCFSRTR